MKLYYVPRSPFARKVRVLAYEKNLHDRIELIELEDLYNTPPELAAINPLGKIPVLVRENGAPLVDSPVICEYVDLQAEPFLIPPSDEPRFKVLHLCAIADGAMDATVLTVVERMMRPEALRWDAYLERQRRVVARSFAALEKEAHFLLTPLSMAHIAIACMCGYIDFRLGDWDWRSENPELAAWYKAFSARESMKATLPH